MSTRGVSLSLATSQAAARHNLDNMGKETCELPVVVAEWSTAAHHTDTDTMQGTPHFYTTH